MPAQEIVALFSAGLDVGLRLYVGLPFKPFEHQGGVGAAESERIGQDVANIGISGLIGNEIKTARDIIVKSTPIDLALTGNSPWIWARATASGIDTLIL